MKYKQQSELGPNSIELWAKELDNEPHKEFSMDESRSCEVMILNEGDVEKDRDGMFAQLLGGWNGTSILHKRLQVHTFTMSKAALIVCGLLIDSPGAGVMMLNYFQYKCHQRRIKHIDMRALCRFIIPMGWFSKDTLSTYWDKQKYVSDDNRLLNMLDNSAYSESIRISAQ